MLSAAKAVEMWCSFLLRAGIRWKLPCVYLANDLIQKAKLINKKNRALMEAGYCKENDYYHQFHLVIANTFVRLFTQIGDTSEDGYLERLINEQFTQKRAENDGFDAMDENKIKAN